MQENGATTGKSWKAELANGLAKGGPAAILLGCVMYWIMNIANAKLDKLIDLQGDTYRAMFNIERLLRGDTRQASVTHNLREP